MGVFNHGHECLGHLEVLMTYLNRFFFQGGVIIHYTSLMTKKPQEFVGTFEFNLDFLIHAVSKSIHTGSNTYMNTHLNLLVLKVQ